MASEELSRELPHLSLSAGNIMLTATKDTVSIVCGNGLIAEQWVQLGVPRSPRAFSATLLSTQSANSMYWCLGFLHLGGRTLPFLLLNFIQFLSTYFFSLSRSLCVAAQPSGV